ncbi:5'-nucleotidase SurE [Planctomycetales bacterium]|nr:5'-nucleotidase SurE [Planctomycetales bacterium]
MKILLTNDDGIDAPGLRHSVEMLAPFNAELAIFAPKRNHSGAGHSITLWREIEILLLEPRDGVPTRWQIDGTPIDAVKFALDNQNFAPDLVVSGINNGENIGTGIYYSGTTQAALEAYFHRVPALALSVENYRHPRYDTAAHWGRIILEKILPLIAGGAAQPFVLNVNVPDCDAAAVKGLRVTRQSNASFREKFHPSRDGRPNHYYLDGVMTPAETAPDFDLIALRAGYVSITPLQTPPTDPAAMERFVRAINN